MTPRSGMTYLTALLAASLVGGVVAATFLTPATATHAPADKLAAFGSNIEIGEPGELLTLASGTMRTSGPTDLVFSLSLECSIITKVVTVGDDVSEAQAKIVVWVEVDDQPVGVISGDDGKVTFCDRTHRQTTDLFDDEDATIETYLATKSAHAFHWVALNVGSGLHKVEVHAELTEITNDDDAFADAVIGKRTLVVEPTKLANDVSL